MSRRLLFIVVVAVCVTGLSGLAAASQPTASSPSGERIIGGSGSNGGTVVEPAYDDQTVGQRRKRFVARASARATELREPSGSPDAGPVARLARSLRP
jgi:hypothetical protein